MKAERIEQPTYVISDSLSPFPRDMTVFARLDNDREFADRILSGERGNQKDKTAGIISATSFSVAGLLSKAAYSTTTDKRKAPASLNMQELTTEIKSSAKFFGASLVGIARINRLWLYAQPGGAPSAVSESLSTAVVLAVEMDRKKIALSPGPEADAATGSGYSKMAFVTTFVSELIRNLGYQAKGCGNDTGLSIPLAIDAGLGEMGRNGMLLAPEYGSCLRLCKVLTDMPLIPDSPVTFGIRSRCESCKACVAACPVGAVCGGDQTSNAIGPSSNGGVLKWPVDGEKCRRFWHINGNSCSNCIKACPLTPR